MNDTLAVIVADIVVDGNGFVEERFDVENVQPMRQKCFVRHYCFDCLAGFEYVGAAVVVLMEAQQPAPVDHQSD